MIEQKIAQIQCAFKCKKSRYNKFGKFYYRSVEDLYEALKPMLCEKSIFLSIATEVSNIGNKNYLRGTANFTDLDDGSKWSTSAVVEIDAEAPGMSAPQKTGSANSYLCKYLLQNILLIDETENDPDSDQQTEMRQSNSPQQKKGRWNVESIIESVSSIYSMDELAALWKQIGRWSEDATVKGAFTKRKEQLKAFSEQNKV